MSNGRRHVTPVPQLWVEEGQRVASTLSGISAVVVLAPNSTTAAHVAIGIARDVARTRRTAIADLTGAAPLRALARPDDAAPGITECFVRGLSLNDAARPAADDTSLLFILPRGRETLSAELLASARWGRLAAGFAEADALLLIVAPSGAEGLDALVPQTDGVVAIAGVEVPMQWRVVAQVDDLTAAAPSAATNNQSGPRMARPVRRALRALTGILLVGGLIGVVVWLLQYDGLSGMRARFTLRTDSGNATAPPSPKAVGPAAKGAAPTDSQRPDTGEIMAGQPPLPRVPQDTMAVPEPVNPLDSVLAAQFAVEIVATNAAASAHLWVREHGSRLANVTTMPVVLGSTHVRWYRVVSGAFRERAAAEALLASLRREGTVDARAGRVVRTPLALQLESNVPRAAASARVAALAAGGVDAYALLQDDGTTRLYAGAYESAAAAVPLHAELRALGLAPQLAYRTGRTF